MNTSMSNLWWAHPRARLRSLFAVLIGLGGALFFPSSLGATSLHEVEPSALPLPEVLRTPVLTVSAGILPTHPLALLDRFDEWMEHTIFTFGVPSLRAWTDLHSASERIAELQMLDAEGIETLALRERLLTEHRQLLESAATIVAHMFSRGGRPIALARDTVRTTLASMDALDHLVEDPEEWQALVITEGEMFETHNRQQELFSSPSSLLEERVDHALFANGAVLPPPLIKDLLMEKLSFAERRLMMLRQQSGGLNTASPPSAHETFLRLADTLLARAHAVVAAGRLEEALSILHDLQRIGSWIHAGIFDPIGTNTALPPSVQERLDLFLQDSVGRGWISEEERSELLRRAEDEALGHGVTSPDTY